MPGSSIYALSDADRGTTVYLLCYSTAVSRAYIPLVETRGIHGLCTVKSSPRNARVPIAYDHLTWVFREVHYSNPMQNFYRVGLPGYLSRGTFGCLGPSYGRRPSPELSSRAPPAARSKSGGAGRWPDCLAPPSSSVTSGRGRRSVSASRERSGPVRSGR